ncbi:MAG: ABC transporter permease [Chromatiaceae bacterium]|nr:ABC transporter permease [Gammaproteobacteria bacterium]MCP5304301.1 ABC transporter permease [Chromatiaceae bacterium]MCP5314026.1 ABC transporter permease [Chromatiaceae bacterium]
MLLRDLLHLTGSAIVAHRTRSLLTGLGIAVGIAAVVLLTAIGEGVQRFVVQEFTQFGTNLIAISPGKTETFGLSGAVISNVRPLSLDDAHALTRLPQVEAVVPFVQGNAAVEAGGRTRRTTVFGTGAEVPQVWQIKPVLGRFLPDDEPRRARPFAVLGSTLRDELFGDRSPLGERIRVGGETYRIIGSMQPKGQMLGFDLDDTVYIPIGRAMAMFDRESLMEVDILYHADADAERLAERIRERLTARHGSEDFTIVTQDQMLEVLGSVLEVLTLAVGALGAISLLVGGIGILTIMTISVNERTGEVGLLRALGAGRNQIVGLFLGEAVVLAGLGGVAGLLLGIGGAWLVGAAVPGLPTHIAWDYVLLAFAIAVAIGLLAGVTPAIRAAGLDPVAALRDE